MTATYLIKKQDLTENFLKVIDNFFKKNEELRITIEPSDSKTSSAAEREKAFFELFGSWQGEETAEELVNMIYADRVNSKDVDL